MDKCSHFQNEIYLYVYDELSGQDKTALEKHIALCGGCASQLKEIQSIAELADRQTVPEPSPEFWSAYHLDLQKRIKREGYQPSRSMLGRFLDRFQNMRARDIFPRATRFTPAVAAVVALLIAGVLVLKLYQTTFEKDTISRPARIAREPEQVEEPPVRYTQKESKDKAIFESSETASQVMAQKEPEPVEGPPARYIPKDTMDKTIPESSETVYPMTAQKEPPPAIDEKAEISPSLEKELMIQELALMRELGEDVDVPENDAGIIQDVEIIMEFDDV